MEEGGAAQSFRRDGARVAIVWVDYFLGMCRSVLGLWTVVVRVVRHKVVHFGECRGNHSWFGSCIRVYCWIDHATDASLQLLLIRAVVVLLQLSTLLALVFHLGSVALRVFTTASGAIRSKNLSIFFLWTTWRSQCAVVGGGHFPTLPALLARCDMNRRILFHIPK